MNPDTQVPTQAKPVQTEKDPIPNRVDNLEKLVLGLVGKVATLEAQLKLQQGES